MLQTENTFEANLKALQSGVLDNSMFWVLLRLALHLSLREGRSVSGEEKARIVAVISNLARSIAQLNVNGFLPGGLVSTLSSHVEVSFNGSNLSVCKLMPKVVLLKTFGINGKTYFD